MRTVCVQDKCVGCMACMDICPKSTVTVVDDLKSYNAVIGEQCIDCGMCHKICQKNNPVSLIEPKCWYQGWANDNDIRMNGSSGGVAMAVAKAFIKFGGLVCSCTFKDGEFGFLLVDTVDSLHQFAGSKYVKSNPEEIYKKIHIKLKEGNKILFIALPCQVAALRKFVGSKLEENLFTIDLICHGTPSPRVLDAFLNQHGKSLKELKNIKFRRKNKFQIFGDNEAIVTEGINDRYIISFLNSLTYTNNCYECDYARKERVSDLTLGDSWGSELAPLEINKGISLILCQTEKGEKLLEQSNLVLHSVDLELAIARNHQLEHPSVRPKGWNVFFDELSKGKKFNSLVMRFLPKQCFKQNVKQILIKFRIYKV